MASTSAPSVLHRKGQPSTFKLKGAEIPFEDGSWWKLTKELSPTKDQLIMAPFEARTVWLCECVEDPEGLYSGAEREAVIKIKYQ
jgi:hypothetical protein